MEPPTRFCLRWTKYPYTLPKKVSKLLHEESFADVLLILTHDNPSVPIKCHKMVLAASSKLFEQILTQQPTTEDYVTVMMPDVMRWQMNALLEFMYNGQVTVLAEEMNAIMSLGKWLNVKGLTDEDLPVERGTHPSPPPLITSTEISTSPVPQYVSPPRQEADCMSSWDHLVNLSRAAECVLNPLVGKPGMFIDHEHDFKAQGILKTALEVGETVYADSSQGPSTSGEDVMNGHSIFSCTRSPKPVRRRGMGKHEQRKKSKSTTNYKMYTKEQMANAIREVERGRCALTVAKEFGIPSRTLYDRVRKLGIQTQRQSRSPRTSGAQFPQGIGANQNGDIYKDRLDSDEASLALLDMANAARMNVDSEEESRPMDQDMDIAEPPDDDEQNLVHDLSVNRNNDDRNSSSHTKEEKKEEKKDSQD